MRIATHPDYQGMGYGKRTLELLTAFYEGALVGLSEEVEASPAPRRPTRLDMLAPRKDLPPLLRPVTAIKPGMCGGSCNTANDVACNTAHAVVVTLPRKFIL